MNTDSVWNALSSLSVGSVIGWIIVIGTIIGFICAGVIKLYKIFSRINELKVKNEQQNALIEKHDEALTNIQFTLKEINNKLDIQEDMNFKRMKHVLASACNEALDKGEIHAETYKTLEEMYDEYVHVFNGNGYIKSLMERMRDVRIVGKIEL